MADDASKSGDSALPIHTEENDMDPDNDPADQGETAQDVNHSNITVPKASAEKTNKSLRLLGAGQPYRSNN